MLDSFLCAVRQHFHSRKQCTKETEELLKAEKSWGDSYRESENKNKVLKKIYIFFPNVQFNWQWYSNFCSVTDG